MAEYFLVSKEDTVIKLNKGLSEQEINELLGYQYVIEPVKNEEDQKRIYTFKNINADRNTYKLLLRNGALEWVVKTSEQQSSL